MGHLTASDPHAAHTLAQLVPTLHLIAEEMDHLADVTADDGHPRAAQAHRDDAARVRAALEAAGV